MFNLSNTFIIRNLVNSTTPKFFSLKCCFFLLGKPLSKSMSVYLGTYLRFVIFSPHTQFWVNFFSTKKCVNCDKTDLRQKCVNCDKTNFTTKDMNFTHVEAFSTSHMPDVEKFHISPLGKCGKI